MVQLLHDRFQSAVPDFIMQAPLCGIAALTVVG
jgi:hypothetical protein